MRPQNSTWLKSSTSSGRRRTITTCTTPSWCPADVAALNKRFFEALKPGGIYLVIDHAAEAGSGLRDTESLHRIDPKQLRREIEAAGFVFDAESSVLRNRSDDHKSSVFDAGIRGRTDQIVYRFRKPG